MLQSEGQLRNNANKTCSATFYTEFDVALYDQGARKNMVDIDSLDLNLEPQG